MGQVLQAPLIHWLRYGEVSSQKIPSEPLVLDVFAAAWILFGAFPSDLCVLRAVLALVQWSTQIQGKAR